MIDPLEQPASGYIDVQVFYDMTESPPVLKDGGGEPMFTAAEEEADRKELLEIYRAEVKARVRLGMFTR